MQESRINGKVEKAADISAESEDSQGASSETEGLLKRLAKTLLRKEETNGKQRLWQEGFPFCGGVVPTRDVCALKSMLGEPVPAHRYPGFSGGSAASSSGGQHWNRPRVGLRLEH